MVASSVASASGSPCAITQPIAELSSSRSPRTAMRGASLPTREPSPRPVVPSSPVRVVILVSRSAMARHCIAPLL
jgi:hypothetical protein